MNTVHDKILRRFVWFICLVLLIAGFATLLTGLSPFLISIILILEIGAVYSLERRFIGIVGHLGFLISLLGVLLVFNLQSYMVYQGLTDSRSIIFLWIFIAVFVVGFVIFGISTIRAGFVPTEIGYLLLITPVFVFLPFAMRGIAFAISILAIGFFLMWFVSRIGEYDKKICHPTMRARGRLDSHR